MTLKKWRSSAPANLMLMGEHAVVYGQPAIACSLQQRIEIDWQQRNDDQILIVSEIASLQTNRHNIETNQKLKWVTACLQAYPLPFGLTVTIKSEIDPTLGLGSSAAVLAALLGGLNLICEQQQDLKRLFQKGLSIIHQIQKRGSGTDLAASLNGGVVLFNPNTQETQSIVADLSFSLVYCGYKTPTAEVLALVSDKWQAQPKLLENLYQLMGQTTEQAFNAIEKQDKATFYQLVNVYQGLMDALGVNDATMSHLIYKLRQAGATASKISGSGLGDCVLGFDLVLETTRFESNPVIPANVSSNGMLAEEIND